MINKIEFKLLDHIDMTKVNVIIENDNMIHDNDNKPLNQITIQDDTKNLIRFSLDTEELNRLINILTLFRDSK